jgi:hypothetical protein
MKSKSIFIVYWGGDIIRVQHFPSDQTTAPSETQINQHEERPNKGFLLNQEWFWPLKKHTNSYAQTALISSSYSQNQPTIAKSQSAL